MEQLSWIEDIPKAKYVRQTERALYEYAVLKVALENEEELEKKGLGNLFPSMIASYEDSPRGSVISNPTETWGMRRAEKSLKIKQINRAMGILSSEERQIIECKYFDNSQPSDMRVCDLLNWPERSYYRIKDRALRKIATALNII